MPWWTILIGVCILSWLVWLFVVPRLLAMRGVEMLRTRFGPALVFDSRDADGTAIRLLNVGGVYQSVCYTDKNLRNELACLYHQAFVEALATLPEQSEIIVFGGGGFSLPRHLITHFPELKLEVVEIDPKIIELAQEKFFLDELVEAAGERLVINCADAWDVLGNSPSHFDAIINDAFSGKRPLGPMATDEGAALIARHLTDKGIYCANVRSSLEGRRSKPLAEVKEAFSKHFDHLYLVPDRPESPRELGYNAFIASRHPLELSHAIKLS